MDTDTDTPTPTIRHKMGADFLPVCDAAAGDCCISWRNVTCTECLADATL